MASGLPGAAHNGGGVTGADAEPQAARAFYATLGTPWGLRVPVWLPWSEGRRLRHQRLMGLLPADFRQLSPDDDRAARLHARLGFSETAGHGIYVDI